MIGALTRTVAALMRAEYPPAVQAVAAAEYQHQLRALPRKRTWVGGAFFIVIFGLSWVPLIPGALVVASLVYNVLIAALFLQYWRWIGGAVRGASLAVAREFGGKTWESLIMTGVNARQIALAKWWGTLRVVWRGERLLLVLRAASFAWIMLLSAAVDQTPPNVGALVLAAGISTVTPLVVSGLAAAVGLLTSALIQNPAISFRAGGVALLVAMVLGVAIPSSALTALNLLGVVGFLGGMALLLPFEGGVLFLFTLIVQLQTGQIGLDQQAVGYDPVLGAAGVLLVLLVAYAIAAALLLVAVAVVLRGEGALGWARPTDRAAA